LTPARDGVGVEIHLRVSRRCDRNFTAARAAN
jgi:hypothetical protein